METNPTIRGPSRLPLSGLALLFWGWFAGFLWLAAPMAAVLEAGRLLPRRADLSNRDFIRISDLCAVILTVMVAYLLATKPMRDAAIAIFLVLPLPLYPLMLAQAVSVGGKVPLGTVVWSARKLPEGVPFQGVDISYPFAALCLLCASLSNHRAGDYYLGLAAVSALALIRFRPRRAVPFAWAGMFLAALFAGFLGYRCLESLQTYLEDLSADLFYEYLSRDNNPYRTITAIGELGELHLRNSPVFRVRPAPGVRGPLLLRSATYDTFHRRTWVATMSGFSPVAPLPRQDGFPLCAGAPGHAVAGVLISLPRGRGLVPITGDAVGLDELPARQITENRLGSVYAEGTPGLVLYTILEGEKGCDGPPGPMDLSVPADEEDALRELSAGMGLDKVPPAEAVRRVRSFFMENFSYSLLLDQGGGMKTPLSAFLKKTRKGHCELFATAAVLLLREARVYARYTSGYLATEPAGVKNWLVVRERHAHAWARVFVEGRWQDFDPTPPGWVDEEAGGQGGFAKALDFLSNLWFRVSLFRSEGGTEALFPYAMVVVALLGAFLFFRIFRRRWVLQDRTRERGEEGWGPAPGKDSELYQALELLFAELPRREGETLAAFLRRMEEVRGERPDPCLGAALRLHYRYRFDPKGLNAEERARLSGFAKEIYQALSNGKGFFTKEAE